MLENILMNETFENLLEQYLKKLKVYKKRSKDGQVTGKVRVIKK
jgi:hypothetical protein